MRYTGNSPLVVVSPVQLAICIVPYRSNELREITIGVDLDSQRCRLTENFNTTSKIDASFLGKKPIPEMAESNRISIVTWTDNVWI